MGDLSLSGQRRCNYCFLQDARKMAERTGLRLEIVPQKLYDEDDQNSTAVYSETGVAVIVGGARVTWFPREPESCVCDHANPH